MLLFESEKKQSKQKVGLRYTEFQAVVLAGYGHRLYPLTEDKNVPKALLPVANKPILFYVLDWLEKAGIYDVMVVTHPDAEHKIGTYLKNAYDGKIKPSLEVSKEDDAGTADALRVVKDKIKYDFVVISCDLVLDLPPHSLLDYHRIHNPTCTVLFYESSKSEGSGSSSAGYKEDGNKVMQELDNFFAESVKEIVGVDMMSSRLVYIAQSADLDDELSFLVAGTEDYLKSALPYSSAWAGDNDCYVDCQLYVYKGDFCCRSNTISRYYEVNRHMAKSVTDTRVATTAVVNQKTQVGADSLIGEETKIDERTSIKRSIVGSHCIIGKNVKITNSIIMDNVVIEDNVKLDVCIVCNNARIMEKSILKDCEVGAGYVVQAETQTKNEQLVEFRDL
ncbi:7970_t:CDS:2 [Paraglomus occultum]|uniref:Translation initiation factor eIF2B subunit gamma n=1 Tax=Paraglomus occultum TaxID=144539 RepID=A0A9N8Z4Z1_9GLOM|nr:7970_t:CDS:2 [Paraglomus occultum]